MHALTNISNAEPICKPKLHLHTQPNNNQNETKRESVKKDCEKKKMK